MLPTRICIPAIAWLCILIAAGCSHRHDDSPQTQIQPEPQSQTQPDIQTESQTHTVTTHADAGGGITPASISIIHAASTILTVTPDTGYSIASVTPTGCTGVLVGSTYITGPITADCTVAASFVANTDFYTVTTVADANGSIIPTSISVPQGANAILTLTPNSGFSITSVTAFGCSGTLTGTIFTTGPITSNCRVTANFSANVTENTFIVTASAGAGGSITPTSVSVAEGASATLTVTPNTGFSIASVTPTGCMGTLTGNTYTTAPITAHCAMAAVFAANTFTVTASAGAGGSITPTLSSVAHGASTTLSITPESGFSISNVIATGCSGTLTGMMYTTGPITSDCSVTVNFSATVTENTFTVTASAGAGAGGSITPSSVSVVEGASTILTVTPSSGYSIASVTPTGCTGTLTGNTYTSGPITTHCAVTASFVADIYNVTASAGAGGSITPTQVSVSHGETTVLTITPETGFSVSSITASGCNGTLAEYLYTTDPITTGCTVTASFALVSTTTLATHIATGGSHTCALTSISAMQCWGNNFYGELGNGNTTNSLTPVTVTGLSSPAAALAAGAQHTCALTRAGAVQCWGYNRYGQLGNGNTTDSAIPSTVNGLSGTITALVAGSYHTCALSSEGAIQCWGYNANGQLGNGSTVNSTTPVMVTGLSSSASLLVAGAQHNCVLTSLGATQCWGYNLHGQLGNSSTANSTTPVKVTGLSGSAMALAAGSNHTCALTSTGAIQQCWGYNAHGQLGNGSTTNATTAVTATGLSEPTKALAAGAQHTCALTSAGAVLCWGYNLYGQLGNGSTISSSTPVSVTGQSESATALAAGYGHSCVLTSTGAVQCWGYNLYGQLGNGSTTNSATAVAVTGLSP